MQPDRPETAPPPRQPGGLRILLDGSRPTEPGGAALRFFQTTAHLLEDGTFPHDVTLLPPGREGPPVAGRSFDLVHTLGAGQDPAGSLASVFDVHQACSSAGKAAKARALVGSAGVICPTRAARDQLLSRFGLSQDQVHVVPSTPAPVFHPREPPLCKALLSGLQVRKRFILAVGGLQDRRSPRAVLRAAQGLKWLGLDADVVFVGRAAPSFDLEEAACEHDRVGVGYASLGFVGREVLGALYASAFAVVFPCSRETSCLPILEAFASETPVVTSATSAALEVGGDAALYADPSADLWQGLLIHLEQLAENPFLVTQQIQRGRAHLQAHHRPEHCLRALARAYESAAARHGV